MIPVGLSTASVWPLRARSGFELARTLGFDGVEVMVWADPESQDVATLRRHSASTGTPVLAVHSPCLLITQRVWSPDPVVRLRRSVEAAVELGAPTVVVHPPFRWQRRYAAAFAALVAELESESGVRIAVENMFPVRTPRGREVSAFRPSVDPTDVGHAHYTLDLSHTATAGMDALALAQRMGRRLAHVHMGDGTGVAKDEHLLPGRGTQPCAELLEGLGTHGFGDDGGQVVLEVSTRSARTEDQRAKMLSEALLFTRLHLG